MMCDCCDEPIAPGQGKEVPVDGASGAGGTVVLHRDGCQPPPSQPARYPTGRGR